jgi:hypothetical protein
MYKMSGYNETFLKASCDQLLLRNGSRDDGYELKTLLYYINLLNVHLNIPFLKSFFFNG